jgi:hypothetical protein
MISGGGIVYNHFHTFNLDFLNSVLVDTGLPFESLQSSIMALIQPPSVLKWEMYFKFKMQFLQNDGQGFDGPL